MKPYKEIEREVIDVCKDYPECWYKPAVSCPYYGICSSFRDEGYSGVSERTEAFEAAIAARYNELREGAEEVDRFITEQREAFIDDSAIIEALLDRYSRVELIDYGFGDFIRPYFEVED